MDLTLDQLTAVAEDLNDVCKLNPPINTNFETNARGAALTSARNKFAGDLTAEIVTIAEGVDEKGQYDLVPQDIPLLKPETVQVIKALSPEATERLKAAMEPGPGATEEKAPAGKKKGKNKAKEKKVIYTRVNAFVDAVRNLKETTTVESLAKEVNDNYIKAGGRDNLKQSQHLVGVMMPCAVGFGFVIAEKGKISPVQ